MMFRRYLEKKKYSRIIIKIIIFLLTICLIFFTVLSSWRLRISLAQAKHYCVTFVYTKSLDRTRTNVWRPESESSRHQSWRSLKLEVATIIPAREEGLGVDGWRSVVMFGQINWFIATVNIVWRGGGRFFFIKGVLAKKGKKNCFPKSLIRLKLISLTPSILPGLSLWRRVFD